MVRSTAALRRLAIDGRSRLCYPLWRDGVISSRAAPFPMNGKGRGDRVDRPPQTEYQKDLLTKVKPQIEEI